MKILPLIPSVPYYSFSTALGDKTFNFVVRWNTRDAAWYLSIYDAEDVALSIGIRIVLGAMFGNSVADPLRMPPGLLYAEDISSAGIDAGFDDLGTRVRVVFDSFDERVDAALAWVAT